MRCSCRGRPPRWRQSTSGLGVPSMRGWCTRRGASTQRSWVRRRPKSCPLSAGAPSRPFGSTTGSGRLAGGFRIPPTTTPRSTSTSRRSDPHFGSRQGSGAGIRAARFWACWIPGSPLGLAARDVPFLPDAPAAGGCEFARAGGGAAAVVPRAFVARVLACGRPGGLRRSRRAAEAGPFGLGMGSVDGSPHRGPSAASDLGQKGPL